MGFYSVYYQMIREELIRDQAPKIHIYFSKKKAGKPAFHK